jgi:predicted metalloprotease with PDZ domain
VYWSGAALCLLADLHLRRETRDRVSLDTLVGALHARGGASTRVWSLAELTQVFEVASEGRWSVVVSPWLAGTAFPAVEPVLASLGVRVRGGVVTLDPAAPEAALRRAVTSPR